LALFIVQAQANEPVPPLTIELATEMVPYVMVLPPALVNESVSVGTALTVIVFGAEAKT
jgi:hypothetical protein